MMAEARAEDIGRVLSTPDTAEGGVAVTEVLSLLALCASVCVLLRGGRACTGKSSACDRRRAPQLQLDALWGVLELTSGQGVDLQCNC